METFDGVPGAKVKTESTKLCRWEFSYSMDGWVVPLYGSCCERVSTIKSTTRDTWAMNLISIIQVLSLENAKKKQVQWLCNVVRILNSSNLLVEVSIDTAKLTKYYDLQKRLNKYHLPLRLSFFKRHPIQVQKTWLFGLSTFRSTAAFEK